MSDTNKLNGQRLEEAIEPHLALQERFERERRDRAFRFFLLAGGFVVGGAITLLLLPQLFDVISLSVDTRFLRVIGTSFMFIGLILVLYGYLTGAIPLMPPGSLASLRVGPFRVDVPIRDPFAENSAMFRLKDLQDRLHALEANVKAGRNLEAEPTNIPDEMLARLVADDLKRHLSNDLRQKISIEISQAYLNDAAARMRAELDGLSRRAATNLAIGVGATVVAIAILVYLAFWNSPQLNTVPQVLSHYIPKVSVVVFVELFSFFFLRLYRDTLGEIKYYQAELTTWTANAAALSSARGLESQESMETALLALTQIDRTKVLFSADSGRGGKTQVKDAMELAEQMSKLIQGFRDKPSGEKPGGDKPADEKK